MMIAKGVCPVPVADEARGSEHLRYGAAAVMQTLSLSEV